MADKIINCPACGNSVAKSAKSCPNCGATPKKSFFKTFNGRLIKYIVILFMIIGVDYFYNGRSLPISTTPITTDPSQSLSEILDESVNGTTDETTQDVTGTDALNQEATSDPTTGVGTTDVTVDPNAPNTDGLATPASPETTTDQTETPAVQQ